MRLNIETTNSFETLQTLKQVFTNEDVALACEFDESSDFEINPPGAHADVDYVYSAESIIELAAVIPPHKIRIY